MILDSNDYWSMMEPFSTECVAFVGTDDEIRFNAIFDNMHKQYGDDFNVSGVDPHLTCRSVDVEAIKKDGSVIVNNTTYRVRDVQPSGTGITVLELKK